MNKLTHEHMILMLFRCSFFVASLMTLLAVLVILNVQFFFVRKCVNIKLEWVKNYHTKPPHRMHEARVIRLVCVLGISPNQGVMTKNKMNIASKLKLWLTLRYNWMLSLHNICPHTQVAKGLLQICPKDTTKFIGFYK